MNLFSELLIFDRTPNMNGYTSKCPQHTQTPQTLHKTPQHPEHAHNYTFKTTQTPIKPPPTPPKHTERA